MVKGLNHYPEKDRKRMRRRNHIARDLAKPQFHQRVKEGKPKPPPPTIEEWEEDID